MDEEAETQTFHLLDLPWEDVLVPHILCYLPLQHLVNLQRVSKQFYSLIQVYLANCRTFNFNSLIGPCIPKEAFCSMLKDNKVLQNLSLQNCSDWVSDKELLPVIGQNQHLHRVDMSGCTCLTRHSLVAVSLSCMHLQHVGLAHCEWVDRLSLRSLADHCGGLLSIDLTACRQLKDDAICYLAKKCLQLKSLSLAVNANITDESVEEVAKNCRGLEQLDLTGCLRVRNQSIRTLAEYCPKLQSLKNHLYRGRWCFSRTYWALLPLLIFRYSHFIMAVTLFCITWTLLLRGMSQHFKKTRMYFPHILVAKLWTKNTHRNLACFFSPTKICSATHRHQRRLDITALEKVPGSALRQAYRYIYTVPLKSDYVRVQLA
ncbi:unnamed protein product [Menidia menidia]|uniref:F-box/LRR-repeat protein 15 n=1 Tax=Menidia menidia TaxID=238744 RepID=A0A8S4B2X4_9TELE|nr:unnamed protein product [Menidia menidia]